jgi:hypothetical protein
MAGRVLCLVLAMLAGVPAGVNAAERPVQSFWNRFVEYGGA